MKKSKKIKKVLIFFLSFFIFCFLRNSSTDKVKLIREATRDESPVYYLGQNKKGLKVAVISGIHGNELAGIEASEYLIQEDIDWAEMLIIPRANIEACRLAVRNPYYMTDLNRAFPGREKGTDTELIAREIFEIIEREKPDLVFDLHEWEKRFDEDESLLENGLIFNPSSKELLKSLEKLYNEYDHSDQKYKLVLSTGSPEGSINREVSERLKIPVLTIESNMEGDLDERVDFHLEIIERTIKNYRLKNQ